MSTSDWLKVSWPHHSHSGQRSSTFQPPSPCSCQLTGWTRTEEQLGQACIPSADLFPVSTRGCVFVRFGTLILQEISGLADVSLRRKVRFFRAWEDRLRHGITPHPAGSAALARPRPE